jgi:hypothetical protein
MGQEASCAIAGKQLDLGGRVAGYKALMLDTTAHTEGFTVRGKLFLDLIRTALSSPNHAIHSRRRDQLGGVQEVHRVYQSVVFSTYFLLSTERSKLCETHPSLSTIQWTRKTLLEDVESIQARFVKRGETGFRVRGNCKGNLNPSLLSEAFQEAIF